MKQLLLLLLLSPFISIAQDQDDELDLDYFQMSEDKFTKNIVFSTEPSIYENEGKSISVAFAIQDNLKTVSIHLFPHHRDCTKSGLSVDILTREDNNLSMINSNDFECDPPHAQIKAKPRWKKYLLPRDFAKMRNEGVDAVRLLMHDGLFDYNFTEDQSKEVQAILNEMEKICVSRWAGVKD